MGIKAKPLGINVKHQINWARLVCNHNLRSLLITISIPVKIIK